MVPEAFAIAVASTKPHEGFREYVYDDATGERIGPGSVVKGNPTIGYGWALNKRPMSRIFADWHMETTFQELVADLDKRAPWLDRQPAEVVAVFYELAYNCGIHGVMGFRKTLSAAYAGNREKAARELLDSDAARKAPARFRALADRLAGHPVSP